jgi:hypothetical protein
MKKLVGEGKPFHSAVDKTAALLKRKVGTGAEFMKELMGTTGIKPTEINERGLTDIMGMPKMTHDQFMSELGKKPAPAIQEKVLGEKPSPEDVIRRSNANARTFASDYAESADTSQESREMRAEELRRLRELHRPQMFQGARRDLEGENQPHHYQYTLPGGENYREMLIKAPKGTEQFPGVPQHFGGEGNILASMRLKDRTVPGDMGYTLVNKKSGNKSQHYATAEEAQAAMQNMPESIRPMLSIQQSRGPDKKLLHLEELQSDWHQQGRDKGYNQKIDKLPEGYTVKKSERYNDYNVTGPDGDLFASGLSPETATANAIDNLRRSGVPDAPFKKNWEEMALKRLIHHAAEKGYHGIVVTPGQEQAKRYNIGNHIDRLDFSKNSNGTVDISGIKDRNAVVDKTMQTPEQVEGLVGRELAQKIFNTTTSFGSLNGLDLQVGGEGMKAFYDKKVPNILNSIGKKYGVKTELVGHRLQGSPEDYSNAVEKLGIAHVPMAQLTPEQNQKIAEAADKRLHHFPITEEMRKDVLTNGLPLYSQGGKVHMADGGDMDTMKLDLLNRHLKGERLSKAQNQMLGLYHPVGGGKKLKVPTEMMQSTRVPDPNQPMVAEKTITPEDLYKGAGIPLLGDSSIGGELLTHIDNQKLRKPIELQGGKNFMRLIKPAGEEAGWASGTSVISDLANKARIAADMADKVYGLHATMSGTGADFSSMPTKAVLGMLKKSKIDPAKLDEFDAEMRRFKPKFVGIRHRNLEKQLLAPGGGEMRKLFVDRMAMEPFQEAGFPDVAHARYAIQHPELLTRPINSIGAGVSELDPTGRVIKNPSKIHYDYPEHLAQRQYVGGFDVPMHRGEIFQEFEKNRRMFNAEPSSDPRSFDLSTPIQKFDQEWLDKVMPIYLARRKMLLGKAKGGVIKKAVGGTINIKNIGVAEAPDMDVKAFISPRPSMANSLPVGGIFQQTPQQPMQSMQAPQSPQQSAQTPQAPFPPQGAPAQPPSNILQMTPQGQAMSAIKPPQMARGGKVDRDMMMLHVMNRKMKVKHG